MNRGIVAVSGKDRAAAVLEKGRREVERHGRVGCEEEIIDALHCWQRVKVVREPGQNPRDGEQRVDAAPCERPAPGASLSDAGLAGTGCGRL